MPKITAEKLRRFCVSIFIAAGTPQDEAEIVVDNLVKTNLRGVDSHGVRAIPRYINGIKKGRIVPGSPTIVLKDTPTTAMWDSNNGFGFVVGKKAMETAIHKADAFRIGSVGTCNPRRGDDHIGALYHYAEMAAERDMIGIVACNTGPSVVAWGGTKRVLGVNPSPSLSQVERRSL